MSKLIIKNLHVSVDNKEILKNINITINDNDKIAILGPNGSGKSTLLFAIMGHPKYTITNGTIFFNDHDILKMSVDERSKIGIFFAFQNPCEVSGITNSDFLKNIADIREKKPLQTLKFYDNLDKICKKIKFPLEMTHRNLNENFSGGEKKRNEILQMLLINPKFAMLDEIDSGLDIDGIKIISKIINEQYEKGMNFIIVSHNEKILKIIKPNRIIVIIDGKIVADGKDDIVKKISKNGFDSIKNNSSKSLSKK